MTDFDATEKPPTTAVASVTALAASERIDAASLEKGLADKSVVVIGNRFSNQHFVIGRGMTTKVNANVGTSTDCPDYSDVLAKAKVAAKAGAHTLMDLSTVGFRHELDFAGGITAVAQETGLPLGTVPIYEAARRAMRRHKTGTVHLAPSEILDIVEAQAQAGVSFMAIHVGLNLQTLEVWRSAPRNIVSKGGYITAEHMLTSGQENPYFEMFDELLEILHRNNVTLNIGSALRSGATRFNDDAQLAEIAQAGRLARIADHAGVQTVIEGPGHVPYHRIKEIVQYQQDVADGRPFFILGFMTSDSFPGWDHIVSAIGATEAVRHGVSWLCYITPAEHLRMPNARDVRDGVMAARIAAHVADYANGQPLAVELETEHNDKGCLDAQARRQYCSICGQDFCPIQRLHDLQLKFPELSP